MENQIGAYLGHVISQKGVATDEAKISAAAAWPTPQNMKELRGFLGLVGYYRKFVRHFGVICQPLTNLLKKNSLFIWTANHETTFQTLKQALVAAPVLVLPNFDKPFVVETDASDASIGAVLMQEGHPLAFLSKALGPKSRGLSTYEKEYMIILIVVQHWRQYLQQGEFLIYTDHKSLSQLNEQRLHIVWQHKVFTKLLGLQYKVVYKKGAENRVADALSRRAHEAAECSVLSTSTPQWLQLVLNSYGVDAHAKEMVAKLSLDPLAVPQFTLQGGLLRHKSQIWVGNDPLLHDQLIAALLTSALGGGGF
jgi:hypothetical protein